MMVQWVSLGGLALLTVWLVRDAISDMFREEFRTRLLRLPYALLWFAALRIPRENREDGLSEWRAELDFILCGTDGLPLTRLYRGMRYSASMLRLLVPEGTLGSLVVKHLMPGRGRRLTRGAVRILANDQTPMVSRYRRGNFALVRALPLLVILTVQAVLSLRLIVHGTAFPNETLDLRAGRLELAHWLHGVPIPAFPTYFSGAPMIYPPLGALADTAGGGLNGARILSLLFMLGATVFLHGVTRRIFDRRSAAFAAALFVALGSTQILGAFATYDAMTLFLLAASTSLGIRAALCFTTPARLGLLLLAALALVIADATKYAAALFDPVVVIAIACVHWRLRNRWAGVVAALLAGGATALGIVVALAWGGEPYVAGVMTTTLSRQPGTWPSFGLLLVSMGWTGVIALLAVIGAVVVSCLPLPGSSRALAWTLAVAAFLAPTVQDRTDVPTSLFKHAVFGGWFAAVMAGYALMVFIRLRFVIEQAHG